MGDLFDEFMRELERRRAESEGRPPRAKDGPDDEPGGDPDGSDDDDPDRHDVDDDHPDADRADASDDASDDGSGDGPGADNEPTPIRRRRAGGPRRRGTPPPPRDPKARPVGGPDDGAQPPTVRHLLRRVGLGVAIVAGVFLLFLLGVGVDLWTDAIWYKSVAFDSVFWTRIGSQVGLFVGALLVSLVALLLNLWLAGRLAPPPDPEKPGRLREAVGRMAEAQRQAEWNARMAGPGRPWNGPSRTGQGARAGGQRDATSVFSGEDLPDLVPVATWAIALIAVFIAVGIAGSVSGAWASLLLWLNRVPFSPDGLVADPVFGRDISFYLFDLPFYRFAQALVNGLLLACLAVAGARYLAQAMRGGEVFVTRVRVHLAVIAGLFLLSIAFGYQLDKYDLVHSTFAGGAVAGVGYTDANARFLAYDVLTLLSGVAGALLVAAAFTSWVWPLGAIVIVWFSASLVLGRIYPEAIQRLTVDPNEFAQESQYIGNNISMTRLAFGLDQWDQRSYSGTAPLTSEAIINEADTFTNARLWDYRPLQTTLKQLQVVRQYYDFPDVDTDRYLVDGTLRQVMLSGRELAIERNEQAVSWVNQRVIWTHGIGLAMVPVNEVTTEGQPELWVRDLPPVSTNGAPEVTQPRIYFGETDDHYVVTGARQPEFDIPGDSGAKDLTTTWTGTSGIRLDSTLTRLLFSLRFRDLDLLISDQITSASQLLFHRTLSERLNRIAPFLRYDKDPYLVVEGGRLVYVQDAFTISDQFPASTGFNTLELATTSGLYGDDVNYIRNSVKVTMDAYDGTMHFYVNDPSDPLIRAWQGVFPSLFEPMSNMPADLVPHLRVPEELFNVQTRMYGRYHVTDPLTLFNSTDRWTVPDAQTNEQTLPSEAYYVVMRMPGETKAEYLLLQPMIPIARPNMIAWVAARNDGDARGQVVAFRFPSDTTIFGPAQIEARIDQDPTISAQVTLWNQSGSRVLRGNLIVVPVGEALLYLQPVYLQSTSSAFPEFQKIVVASPTTVVWGDTLREALTSLMLQAGPGPSPSPGPTPTPGPSASPGATATPAPTPTSGPTSSPGGDELPTDVDGLVEYANTHFELAQAALRAGDFATYGDEIAKVEAALQRLGELTGVGLAVTRTLMAGLAVAGAGLGRTAAGATRLSLRSVLAGSVVVTLVRPVAWTLGLVGFLAGGGLAVVAWPIVVLPTPTGLQNALGGPVSTLVFGAASPRLLLLIAGAAGAALALLVAGVAAGAWAERQGIGVALEAAEEEGLVPPGSTATTLAGAPGTGRVAILRFLSLGPLAVIAGLAWQTVYDATYGELILPDDLATPLPIRVIGDVPWLVVGLLAAWVVTDAAGSLGVRRLVLERRPVLEAWLVGWVDVVRRPQRVLAVAVFGILVLLVPLVPSVAAAAVGWGRVRDLLASDPSPWLALAAMMTWVAVWLGGLVLVGVAAAARAAAWTLELPASSARDRHPPVAPDVPLAHPEAPDSPVTLPDAAPPSGVSPLR